MTEQRFEEIMEQWGNWELQNAQKELESIRKQRSWQSRLKRAYLSLITRGDAISEQLASRLQKGMDAGMKVSLALEMTLSKATKTGEILREKVADVMQASSQWNVEYSVAAGYSTTVDAKDNIDRAAVSVSTDTIDGAQFEVKAGESKVIVTLPIDGPDAELPLVLLVPEHDDGKAYAKSLEAFSPFFAEAVFEEVEDGEYLVVIQSL
jgi:hypothetical protein